MNQLRAYRRAMQKRIGALSLFTSDQITPEIAQPSIDWSVAPEQPVIPLVHWPNGIISGSVEAIYSHYPTFITEYIIAQNHYSVVYELQARVEAYYTNSLVIIIPRSLHADIALNEMLPRFYAECILQKIVIVAQSGSTIHMNIAVEENYSARTQRIDCFILSGAQLSVQMNAAGTFSENRTEILYLSAHLSNDATFLYRSHIAGISYYQNMIDLYLRGHRSHAEVKSLYKPESDERVVIKTTQHHFGMHTTSQLLCKGVLSYPAQVAYQGNIIVDRSAGHVRASQQNKHLVLHDAAHVWSIPGLEVLNNNVNCAHGSAAGPLDEEQLFYVHTRGISSTRAEQLLIDAFCADVL